MAQNKTDAYRKFRYYEGVCSSGDFIKEIAKVLALGVKSDPIKDADGNIDVPGQVLISKNWDIVYPRCTSIGTDKNKAANLYINSTDEPLSAEQIYTNNANYLSVNDYVDKINNQVSQITNTVVLKATNTPVNETIKKDDLSVSNDVNKATHTMYVQFYMPKYLANPEEYPLDAELKGITPQLITKEMYQKARKSTAYVTYDLSKLAREENVVDKKDHWNEKYKFITSEIRKELVDAVSDKYTVEELYVEDGSLILNQLVNICNIEDFVMPGPNANGVLNDSYFTITKSYLTTIKNQNKEVYDFIFNICGNKSTFTEADYDIIDEMRFHISYIEDENKNSTNDKNTGHCVVSLQFKKNVEIFTINTKESQDRTDPNRTINAAYLDVEGEYGHKSISDIYPELYAEGRYIPLNDYVDYPSHTAVTFTKKLSFSLEKVVDENILYGTVVIRFNYDKSVNYVDLSSLKITDSVSLPNNHYCLIRMFDVPADDFSGPKANIYDNNGNITKQNSHASPWSKLSWYRDFEEIMMDSIDEDVSITSVTDGTLLVPLETVGLTSDTRLSYWINCNNDRATIVVMGNPSLDYERDRHVISSCYLGRIDSFDNSITDVSGNFALYTSSSTTPCKTEMSTNDTQYHIKYQDDEAENAILIKENNTTERKKFIEHIIDIGGKMQFTKFEENGLNVYYLTLTGNKFFNEREMPRYAICHQSEIDKEAYNNLSEQEKTRYIDQTNGKYVKYDFIPLTNDVNKPVYYAPVTHRQFIYGTSDSRSNQVALYIPIQGTIANQPKTTRDQYYVLFNFGYYEQKFVITSGITRDSFGNVIGIEHVDSYGKNTSDGTTSVSMYHTRSKAFYQKHQFLFATTEEYMSKVMYGKSSYTGEYYADRIKITHGNDGPRGILSDTLAIDSSSLYPRDELVINKDFEKDPNELEETFIYFPITAPFSPLSDGPNARYGIAIKKSEREPEYTDDEKILNIAINELDARMDNLRSVNKDTILPDTVNGCAIYWKVNENVVNRDGDIIDPANWIEDITGTNRVRIANIDGTIQYITCNPIDAHNVDITIADSEQVMNHLGKMETSIFVKQRSSQPLFTMNDDEKATNLNTVTLSKADGKKTLKFLSHVVVSSLDTTAMNATKIYYGYSNQELGLEDTSLNKKASYVYIVDDGTGLADRIHKYPYYDMFININKPIAIGTIDSPIANIKNKTIDIENANPEKYLNIFIMSEGKEAVEYTTTENGKEVTKTIFNENLVGYTSILLNNEKIDTTDNTCEVSIYDLLQYPTTIFTYTGGVMNTETQGIISDSSIKQNLSEIYHTYQTPYLINIRRDSRYDNAVFVTVSMEKYKNLFNDTNDPVDITNSNKLTIPDTYCIDDLNIAVDFKSK